MPEKSTPLMFRSIKMTNPKFSLLAALRRSSKFYAAISLNKRGLQSGCAVFSKPYFGEVMLS